MRLCIPHSSLSATATNQGKVCQTIPLQQQHRTLAVFNVLAGPLTDFRP